MLSAVIAGPGAEAGGRIPSTVPFFGLYLQESFDLNLEPDNFYANADSPDSNQIVRCATIDDELCTKATSVMMIHNLPVCSVDSSFDCIKSVWAVDSSGKKIPGEYLNALPVKGDTDRDAIPTLKLSAARGFGGLWKIPGVINGGGTENYFVSARSNGWITESAGAALASGQVSFGPLMTGIIPVKPVAGNYKPMASRPTWGRCARAFAWGPARQPCSSRGPS